MSHFVAYILQFQEIIVYKIPPGGGGGSISSLRSIKAMRLMLLCISIQIHVHLTISDLFLSILPRMRWIVFVKKLTGFINLTRFIQRA